VPGAAWLAAQLLVRPPEAAVQEYVATNVFILADVDNGEGWVIFQWPDELYGYEELTIGLDGHCSRRMPIHSGHGPPDVVELDRNKIRLRFDPELAERLQLSEEIAISYRLTDRDYNQLKSVVTYFNGE
jgi:hypothetical protein